MIKYILTKIRNKYKLYMCLMIGNIAIVMIFAMIMMFRDGSRNKLIQRGFVEKYEETGHYPAIINRNDALRGKEIEQFAEDEIPSEVLTARMRGYEDSWNKYLELPVVATQEDAYFRNMEGVGSFRGDGHIGIAYLDDPAISSKEEMKNHYDILDGAYLHEDISASIADGCPIPENAIPCIISKYTANSWDLVVGELINFYPLGYGKNSDEKPVLQLYVNGIVYEKENDYYWQKTLRDFGVCAIVDKEDFNKITDIYSKDVYYDIYESFDYRYINTKNVDAIDNYIKQFKKLDENLEQSMTPIFLHFRDDSKAVEQMIYVIVLPIIVLVIIFIGMIAFRIIDSEKLELTTLRSRGLSKTRLIGMYIIQSFILAIASVLPGIALGYFFGKLVAGVDDFMGFTRAISIKDYKLNILMLYAGLVAMLIAVIIMMVPVFLFFKKKKNKRKIHTTSFWERYFLDIALLIVSIYLLVNYNKQLGVLSDDVINGKGIDPVIFINSTFFLFACGMLMLRLIFYAIRLVFKIGEKKFSPVMYAGMLQIIRTRKSSGVISVFLVMTVAMSLFNANMARTINANKEARLQHEGGSDIRLEERWQAALIRQGDGTNLWKYSEPSFEIYKNLVENGTFESATKVLYDKRNEIEVGKKPFIGVTMMAIHTKEFGETARLKDGLTSEHWYNYLNALSENAEGVIISKNLADKAEVKVGDALLFKKVKPEISGSKDTYANLNLKIVAITESWPGFDKYEYELDENGKTICREKYLVVMNYGNAVGAFGLLPYEVWAKTGLNEEQLNETLADDFEKQGRSIKSLYSWKDKLQIEKSSAIIQITNGIFTGDFLVALILCIIGYMIYWITSIRDRELLFGIYRAMGISSREINKMIGMEQLFLSLMSILAGVFAGTLASSLFVKVFAAVYLPKKHSVSVFVSSYGADLIELAAILLVVVIICVIWIRKIIKGMNITEALKLGDD